MALVSGTPASGSPDPIYVLTRHVIEFQETAGAGTYSAAVVLPAGAHVLETAVYVLDGPWDADTADLTLGDTAFPHGYFDDRDLTGTLSEPYDPTATNANANMGKSWDDPGYEQFATTEYYPSVALYANAQPAAGAATGGVFYDSGDTLTATVVTTGAGGTTGHTVLSIIGFGVTPGHTDAVKS